MTKKIGKIDKYTTYINAFKVAGDELSKLNLDTNDNGIGKKELEDITGDDIEEELTPGQKSLVWENQDDSDDDDYVGDANKILALAQYLAVDPSEIEYDTEMYKYYQKGESKGYYVYSEDEDYEDEATHFLAKELRDGDISIKEMNLDKILFYAEETTAGYFLSYFDIADYLLENQPLDKFLATETVAGKTYIIL